MKTLIIICFTFMMLIKNSPINLSFLNSLLSKREFTNKYSCKWHMVRHSARRGACHGSPYATVSILKNNHKTKY